MMKILVNNEREREREREREQKQVHPLLVSLNDPIRVNQILLEKKVSSIFFVNYLQKSSLRISKERTSIQSIIQ